MNKLEDVLKDNEKEIVMHGSSLAYSLKSGANHAKKGRKIRTAISIGSAGYSVYKLAQVLEDGLSEEDEEIELHDIPVTREE